MSVPWWVLVVILIGIFSLFFKNKEGFQGQTALQREDNLFPLQKSVSRKIDSYGEKYNDVPLVIYQSWAYDKVPFYMKKNIEKLLEQNPEFNYSYSSDDDCRKFIAENFDKSVVESFDCLKPGAYKSDLWRYCVLYVNGGVYIDIKMQPKPKLIELIKENPVIFVKDDPVWPNCSWNGFMVSPPQNPIFKMCIDEIVRMVKLKDYGANTLELTGPCLLGRIVRLFLPKYKYPLYFKNYKMYSKDGDLVMTEYSEYRAELKRFQKTKHYSEAWFERDVFQC